MADLSSWTVYPSSSLGAAASCKMADTCDSDLTFDQWSAERAHAQHTHAQTYEDAVRTSWTRIAFVGPLTLQAGGRPWSLVPGPWSLDTLSSWSAAPVVVSACQHYFSINFSFFIKLTQKFGVQWPSHLAMFACSHVSMSTGFVLRSARCAVLCFGTCWSFGHLVICLFNMLKVNWTGLLLCQLPFDFLCESVRAFVRVSVCVSVCVYLYLFVPFLLHLFCRHWGASSFGVMSRSQGESLNEIKSVPACAAAPRQEVIEWMAASRCSRCTSVPPLLLLLLLQLLLLLPPSLTASERKTAEKNSTHTYTNRARETQKRKKKKNRNAQTDFLWIFRNLIY